MPASPSAARTYVRRFVSRNRVASTRGIPAWSRLGDGKRDQRDGGLTGVETQVELTRHETTQRRGGHGPMYEEQVTPALAADWPGARVREGKAHDSKSIVAGGREAAYPASRPLRSLQDDLDLGENESSAAFLEPHPDQVARLELVGDGDVVRPEEPGTVVERDDFLRHLDSLHPTLHVVGRGEAGPEQHAERECPR